jgi:uncharacterized protein
MPRPQGVQPDKFVDATVLTGGARSASTLQRSYAIADMPRLHAAGAGEGTAFKVTFCFLGLDAHVAIDGALDGVAKLTCQRCLQAVDVRLDDEFKLVIVPDEAVELEEAVDYEPVVADPKRLDLQALAEDQALLALPLVPRHESDSCVDARSAVAVAMAEVSVEQDAQAVQAGAQSKQMPFKDLRDMMRKR